LDETVPEIAKISVFCATMPRALMPAGMLQRTCLKAAKFLSLAHAFFVNAMVLGFSG
jgi:hypothetical protein